MIAKKLRALYSRKKGLDLYNLGCAFEHRDFDLHLMLNAFNAYIASENRKISRAEFEKNLHENC